MNLSNLKKILFGVFAISLAGSSIAMERSNFIINSTGGGISSQNAFIPLGVAPTVISHTGFILGTRDADSTLKVIIPFLGRASKAFIEAELNCTDPDQDKKEKLAIRAWSDVAREEDIDQIEQMVKYATVYDSTVSKLHRNISTLLSALENKGLPTIQQIEAVEHSFYLSRRKLPAFSVGCTLTWFYLDHLSYNGIGNARNRFKNRRSAEIRSLIRELQVSGSIDDTESNAAFEALSSHLFDLEEDNNDDYSLALQLLFDDAYPTYDIAKFNVSSAFCPTFQVNVYSYDSDNTKLQKLLTNIFKRSE